MAKDIYFKLSADQVEGFEARMKAIGVTMHASLPNSACYFLDRAHRAQKGRDPKKASEALKKACDLPPLVFEEVSVVSCEDPETGKSMLRLLENRPADQSKRELVAA